MRVVIRGYLPDGLACCCANGVDMAAAVAEQCEVLAADAGQRDCRPHAGACSVVPMITAGLCVDRVHVPALRANVDTATHDRRLTEHGDHPGEAERPFEL